MNPRVGIDPGHGGNDSGAVNEALKIQEKDITLPIALKLSEYLSSTGYRTVLTRTEDTYVSLRERANILNNAGVDAVVSVHINSSVSSAPNYLSTHVLDTQGKAGQLALRIQQNLVVELSWPDGGVKTNNFFIVRETKAPAVLVELGFISNEEQARALLKESIQVILVRGIVKGFDEYFGMPQDNQLKQPTDITGHWAEESIDKVKNLGLMSGYPDGSFLPDNPVTRAELATVLARLWDQMQLPVEGVLNLPPEVS